MDGGTNQQPTENASSAVRVKVEVNDPIPETLSQLQIVPKEEVPTDDSLRTAIAEVDVLIVHLEKIIAKIEGAKAESIRRQKDVIEKKKALENAGNFMKRKIPVQRYLPPYFRDSDQMYAPYSEEGMRRMNMTVFDPMLREEKRWSPKDIAILRKAVHNEMIEVKTEELISRRDQLRERLCETGQDTTQQEIEQWKEEIELCGRKIAYEKNQSETYFIKSVDVNKIDWVKISNLSFDGVRRAEALRLKWINELSPIWNQGPWSEREKIHLQQLRDSKKESWPLIANKLQTKRSPWQCFQKYRTDCQQNKEEWTQEEDKRLIDLCEKLKTVNGRIQWEKVTYYMKGRNRQQVRTRYNRKLNKFVKHGPWTDQEDLLLITAVNQFGAREWSKIAKAIPCRNDVQCRERWVSAMDQRLPREWSQNDDEKLIFLVATYGLDNWFKYSRHLLNRTPIQCRNRYSALMVARSRFYTARERNMQPGDDNKNSLANVMKIVKKSQVYNDYRKAVAGGGDDQQDEDREAMKE